ncbi:hypothetical protein U1707_08540 [Sphingomonas sp. PB2P12]|uniref:hypothetical protein n=1 Tax=Sphingomonas sandaracina TaxID=3096157 RepID=UPI002FC7B3CA
MRAVAILAEHGTTAADYILSRLSDVPDDDVAAQEWRRIAAALDEINRAATFG